VGIDRIWEYARQPSVLFPCLGTAQFEKILTPKAFANFSPGLELATTLGFKQKTHSTLKGFANRLTLSGLERL
jgi:hypothetical protein